MSLTLQQQKNLEAAVRAATTAPSASNPLVTAAEQPIEQVLGKVQFKSTANVSEFELAGFVTSTTTIDAYAGWDSANVSGCYWSTDRWARQSISGVVTANIVQATAEKAYGGFTPNLAFNQLTSGSSPYINALSNATYPTWIQAEFTTPIAVTSYRIYDAGDGFGPATYELRGSNDAAFSTYTIVHSSTEAPPSGGWTSAQVVTSPGMYKYYRLHIKSGKYGPHLYIYELELTSNPTSFVIPTPNLVTGTQSFSPSTLKLYTTTSMLTELNSGEATISFKKIIGGVTTDYGSQESLATFRARPASEFANCTSLWFKVAPVGAYTVGGLKIDTIGAGSAITLTSNTLGITVGGSPVYEVQNDGDLVTADITADDITMTGDLSMDTTKTTIATVTTTDATATVLKAIALAADKTMSIDIDIIANKASTATKNKYRIVGTFYRNGSGNVTQLGDLVSIDTNEADTDWNATIVANTGDQTVDVQITGEAATTIAWSGKITYNIA